MNCSNCGSQLTCGCQKRVASNGAQVCQNCIAAYEKELIIRKQREKQPPNEEHR